jgi:hypothetical protein
MQKAQQELANMEVTGQAGGGMVSVVMNGQHAVKRVTIDPTLADDIEMLEDLVVAATNDAVNRIKESTEKQMAEMTQGMSLPPGFKLPF